MAKRMLIRRFGLYAQCEDDFKRVELNYIEKIRPTGWNWAICFVQWFRIKLLIDTKEAKADYKKKRRGWKIIKQLRRWYHYYLYKHPSSARFTYSFWTLALALDRRSIGTLALQGHGETAFYSGNEKVAYIEREKDVQTGSNGFAIAPSKQLRPCYTLIRILLF
jgi:hypothetical protein